MNRIENALKNYLENNGSEYSQKVYDSMSYSIFGAGKRIRPQLTMLFTSACGENIEKAIPFASAVEMIHTYSLIHDDLPAMDNDDMRRGRASNHIVYGEDIALLAGDGLLTKAFEICLNPETIKLVGAEKASSASYYLSKCSGADGMVGGQCIDLCSEDRDVSPDELYDMVYGKTVNLIKAASVIGVIISGGNDEMIKAAEDYSVGIGMAFQIRDDILDVIGDPTLMGKNVGVDKNNNKKNYVTLFGIEKCESLVSEYTDNAISALSVFPNDTSELKELAILLANRDH